SRRSLVIERLRRVLFSPSKLSVVGALALILATADASFAQTYTMPNFNISVAENGGLLYLADWYAYNDPSQAYDKTITLDGGTIALSTGTTAPVYDAETQTLHMRASSTPNISRETSGKKRIAPSAWLACTRA
ncbi:MAG: hypothetical protein IJE97_08225, partial [Thermoguttaceae bacterium]|nr:hypothetical protein [Thermoguttaceae bacterium]